jgi:centromere protein I
VTSAVLAPLRTHLESRNPPQSLSAIFSLPFHPALVAIAGATMRELEDRLAGKGERIAHSNGGGDAMDVDTNNGPEVRHAGPVTQKSLALLDIQGGVSIAWSEYRLEVLRWMETHGAGGVSALMFCTMKHLMSQGEKRARESEVKEI